MEAFILFLTMPVLGILILLHTFSIQRTIRREEERLYNENGVPYSRPGLFMSELARYRELCEKNGESLFIYNLFLLLSVLLAICIGVAVLGVLLELLQYGL